MTSNRKQPLASIFSSFTGNGGASTSSTKRGDGEESVLPMMISGSSNAGGKGSLNQSGDRIALVMAGMAASTSLYVMNQTLISTSLGSHDQTTHGSNEEEEVTEQKEPQFNPIMVSIVLAALTSVFQLLISHVLLSLRRKSKDDSYSGINRRYVQEARLTLWQGIKVGCMQHIFQFSFVFAAILFVFTTGFSALDSNTIKSRCQFVTP
eukprot:gb/GECG01002916.1/.p1 GENE.gb/GECG01002916.1/~~gb/GECG01002916.1/.p1  ORF type:complete len:208 (+),score=18.31 gb/GECG01002916.1/:1-624(+)